MTTQNQRWNEALKFIIDDLHTIDEDMRVEAHKREFYNEYMWIRDSLIEHCHTLWRPVK